MKLEEAVQKAELLMRRGCRGELGLVLDTLIRHAEATRWRELSEGKPGPGLYLCRCQSPIDGFVYYRVELATADGFQYAYVTDFMRIIDREDSNE